MKKMTKRMEEAGDYLFLAVLTLFFCWLFAGQFGWLGAKTDWLNQHAVFPEYFRQQFYETGKLFPEFAPNIGAGQNIYYFSYYGLLSPVVLFSYFFPMVSMERYLVCASVAGLATAVLLFYRWLRNNRFSRKISFLCALLFCLVGPMIYHTFKQIMFVNYMPFLLLALIGVDRYFEKNKPGVLILGTFLMIMTSFYFSVGGILALVLYGLYRYSRIKEENRESIRLKGFIKDGFRFLLPIIAAVLMSCVLLAPTALTLGGRENVSNGETVSFLSLFLPTLKPELFFYGYYGLGLTTLGLTVLFTGILKGFTKGRLFNGTKGTRILFWGLGILFFIPFFCYLLNGGLYVRAKAMLPFLPLFCFCFAWYADKMEKGEISFINGLIPYGITILFLFAFRENIGKGIAVGKVGNLAVAGLIGEAVLMLVFFLIHRKFKRTSLLLAPSVLFLFLFACLMTFYSDGEYGIQKGLTTKEYYEKITDVRIKEKFVDVLEQEERFYRAQQQGTGMENLSNINRTWSGRQYISSLYASTYNKDYMKFRSEIFQVEEPYRNFLMQSVSKNPIFEKVMGVKYVLKRNGEEWNICENKDAAPVLYGSSRIITETEYKKLEFPINQMALAEYVSVSGDAEEKSDILKGDWKKELEKNVTAASFEFSTEKTANALERTENGWKIKSREGFTTAGFIERTEMGREKSTDNQGETDSKEILFLRFRVENFKTNKDVKISINGMQNKQSAANHIYRNNKEWFTYGIELEPGISEISVSFGSGEYEITDLDCYVGRSSRGWNSLYESDFNVNWEQTKGNVISGEIDMETTGYLVSSIPYEESFSVFVDGKETGKVKTNTAFLGCRLSEGVHRVEIVYHAPGLLAGKILSVLGCFLAFGLIWGRRLLFFVEYDIVHINVKKVCSENEIGIN